MTNSPAFMYSNTAHWSPFSDGPFIVASARSLVEHVKTTWRLGSKREDCMMSCCELFPCLRPGWLATLRNRIIGSYKPEAGKATEMARLCVRTGPPSLPRPAPFCPVHRRAPPGAPGHLCVHSVRAEGYSESGSASMDNCGSDLLYQGRGHYFLLPSLPRRRKSSSGSSEPSMRTHCKGPLQEPGLQGGYSGSRCASLDNCRSGLVYQDRSCYSSLPGIL